MLRIEKTLLFVCLHIEILILLRINHIFFSQTMGGVQAPPIFILEKLMSISSTNVTKAFADCEEFVCKEVFVGGNHDILVYICYLEGLVSTEQVGEGIVRAIDNFELSHRGQERQLLDMLLHGSAYIPSAVHVTTLKELIDHIVDERCAIVFDNIQQAITFDVKSGIQRSIGEPKIEKTVKGSKDAFVESLRVNTMLLRRKLHTPDLKTVRHTVGVRSRTSVDVVYIAGLTNKDMVRNVTKRIQNIDIDGMLTTSNLEEYIVDNPKTPFPQMITTERADKFALNLLEGRVGILVDGIPLGFLVPGEIGQFFKVPEDNTNHFIVASSLTLIRYFAMAISLFLPALYVAISMYQQQMIPTQLMITIIDSKANVPITTALEVLGMMIAFELLQESGLRLPTPVGETIGIIGALIVGESAVSANVMSPIVVIVVALAGIAGYTMPNQDFAYAIRISRFLLVICALMGGMFGIGVGTCVLLYHLCSLESFGVPYMTPFCNGTRDQITSTVFRKPLASNKWRQDYLRPIDRRNQR